MPSATLTIEVQAVDVEQAEADFGAVASDPEPLAAEWVEQEHVADAAAQTRERVRADVERQLANRWRFFDHAGTRLLTVDAVMACFASETRVTIHPQNF